MNDVVKTDWTFAHFQSNHGGFFRIETFLDRLSRKTAAGSGIFPVLILSLRPFGLCVELLFGTEAPERVTGIDQTQSVLLVYGKALRLPVWTSGTADVRPFVPIDAQPSQVPKDLFFVLGPGALLIRVFNPQNVGPLFLPGEKPGKQTGPDVAKVK